MPTTNWNRRKKCADKSCETIISDEATHCKAHTPGNSRPVEIEGKVYDSIKLAIEAPETNVKGKPLPRSTVIYRLKSKSRKWANWKYVDIRGDVDGKA